MWEIVRAGGPFMWPIIICSVVLVGIVLERLWTLQRKRVLPQTDNFIKARPESKAVIDAIRATQA